MSSWYFVALCSCVTLLGWKNVKDTIAGLAEKYGVEIKTETAVEEAVNQEVKSSWERMPGCGCGELFLVLVGGWGESKKLPRWLLFLVLVVVSCSCGCCCRRCCPAHPPRCLIYGHVKSKSIGCVYQGVPIFPSEKLKTTIQQMQKVKKKGFLGSCFKSFFLFGCTVYI